MALTVIFIAEMSGHIQLVNFDLISYEELAGGKSPSGNNKSIMASLFISALIYKYVYNQWALH